jgi:nucleoside-diphosphate-sugar epimerase
MNLLKLARKDSLKGFLFFSTGGVYGKVPDHLLPMKETDYGYLDPLDVRSCYNESKRMGENICVSWQSQYGLPVKIARISYVYGPGMDLDDERVFPSFVAKIVRGEDIIMNSQGKATRAFCYIADATLAFFTILLKGKEGDAYNVGVEKETSVLELAKILIDLSPSQKLRLIIEPTDDPHHRADTSMQRSCLAIDRIKKLGWAPIYDLPEGCRRTVQSYL